MKNITSHRHSSGEAIVGAKLNKGIKEHSEVFNGALDSNDIPLNAIDYFNLPANAFKTYTLYDDDFQNSYTISAEQAAAGWVSIDAGGTEISTTYFEGICRGAACVTVRNIPYTYTTGTAAALSWETYFIRLGVFYNGMIVAESEPITHSMAPVELPFCFSTIAGPATIEMKIFIGVSNPQSSDDIIEVMDWWIWAKGAHA